MKRLTHRRARVKGVVVTRTTFALYVASKTIHYAGIGHLIRTACLTALTRRVVDHTRATSSRREGVKHALGVDCDCLHNCVAIRKTNYQQE